MTKGMMVCWPRLDLRIAPATYSEPTIKASVITHEGITSVMIDLQSCKQRSKRENFAKLHLNNYKRYCRYINMTG